MADVNLSLGVNVDLGDLNRELSKVRRIVEDKLKNLKLDISGANVSSRSRAGKVQGSLRPELLSASSKERTKAQESATKALTSQISTLDKQLGKASGKLQELTKKRNEFISIERKGAEEAKKAGTSLGELRRNIGRLAPNIDKAAQRQARLSEELTRTKGALADLRTFFDATNRALDTTRSAQARAAGVVEVLANSARGAANALDIFTRAGRAVGRTPVPGQVGDRIGGGGGGGRPPSGPVGPGAPSGGGFNQQEFLATFGRTLTAGIVRGFELLGTESLRLANVTGNVADGFRRTASAAERLERASDRGTQAITARRQSETSPNNRSAAGGQQSPTVDSNLARAQERSFSQQRQRTESERASVAREINAASLEAGREFVRSQLAAGRDIQSIADDFRRVGPVTDRLRRVIESEATSAIKTFSTSVIASAASVKKIDGRSIGFGDVEGIVAGAGETLRKRFSLFGSSLQRATDIIRTRLVAAIEKRIEGELKAAQGDANERARLAALQAKRAGALAASIDTISPGATKASTNTLRAAAQTLGAKFKIGGDALEKALFAFAKSFESERTKRFKDSERARVKEAKIDASIAEAKRKVQQAELERASKIRRAAASQGLTGSAAGVAAGVAGGIGGGQGARSFSGLSGKLNKLDPAAANAATRAILGQGAASEKAGVQLSTFSRQIATSNGLVRKFAGNLSIGQRAAFEFGVSAQNAAGRLAAWAAPSVFVFQAIGALRTALDVIVKLDTQLRRLSFFQQGDKNPFVTVAGAIAGFESPAQQFRANMNSIINIAEETGLKIEDVTEAVVTLSRVGKQPLKFNVETQSLEPTRILEAVQGLVRLEGGALSAARATEILNAILEQNNLTAQDATLVAASLATQSRKTSFEVERLGVVVTGVGSAFRSLQNLTFDETLAIASVAAKRLGTNASRTRTALRQLSTLFVRFSKEIEEATGVQVADDSGQLLDVTALFKALKEVDKLRGTTGGFALADLFAEAENIPDLQNLAAGANDFIEELRTVGSSAVDIGNAFAFTEKAVKDFLDQGESQARGFEASINRLSTAIVKFADEIQLDEAFKGFVDTSKSALSLTSSLVNTLGQVPGLLKAIVGVSLAPLLKVIGRIGLGFASAALGAKDVTGAQGALTVANQTQGGAGLLARGATGNVVLEAQKEGVITQRTALALTKQNNQFLESRLIIDGNIAKLNADILLLEKRYGVETSKTKTRKDARAQQEKLLVELEAKELALQKQITLEIQKGNTARTASSRLGGIASGLGTAALGVGLVFGDEIGSAISKDKSISGAISGAITGATTGALLGSAVPILGTALGALVGGAIGGIGGAISGSDEEAKAQEEKIRREKEINDAIRSRRRQIIDAANARLRTTAEITAVEAQLIELRRDAELAQIRVAEAQEKGKDASAAQINLGVANNKLLAAQNKLRIEEKDRIEDTIRREKELLGIRTRRARLDIAASTIRDSAVFSRERGGARGSQIAEVEFTFDRQALQTEASAIQQELAATRRAAASIRGRTGRGQEQRSLETRAKKLEEQLQTIRFKGLQLEFNARRDILKAATEEQTKQVDAWRDAAKVVVGAFDKVIQDQKGIAQLIGRSSDIDIDVQAAQTALKNLIPSLLGDISSSAQVARNNLAGLGARRGSVNARFDAERDALRGGLGEAGGPQSTTVSLQELAVAANDLKASLASTKNESELSSEARVRRAAAQNNADLLTQRANINKRLLDIEISRANAINKIINEEISTRRELIKTNKSLIEVQARRGKLLLDDPEKFITQLRQIQLATNVFGGSSLGGADGFRNIQQRVNQLANQPGGRAILQEIQAGLQAAVAQGIKINGGLTAEELVRNFQAAIIPGGRAPDAAAAVDANVAELQRLNGSLQDNLSEQRKLVNQQIVIQQALARLNTIQADFSSRSLAAEEKTTKELTDRLVPLEKVFNIVSSKVDELKAVTNTLLRGTEFADGARLISSTIQQLQAALLINRGDDFASANSANVKGGQAALFNLLGSFRGALDIKSLTEIGGKKGEALLAQISKFSANQIGLLANLVDQGGQVDKGQTEALRKAFPGIDVFKLTGELFKLNSGSNNKGISDLRGGQVGEALIVAIRKIATSSGARLQPGVASRRLGQELNRSGAFDDATRNQIVEASNARGLPELVSQLRAAQVASRKNPSDVDAEKRANDLGVKVTKLAEEISQQISTGAVLEQLVALLRAAEEQRAKELESRRGFSGDTAEVGAFLKKVLEDATVIQGKAASEERKEFIKLLSTGDNAAKSFDDAIRRLEKSLSDGIKITSNPIDIQFNSNIKTELAANAELKDVLLKLSGGNKEEADRALRVIGELVRVENKQGTPLTAEALEVGSGG